MPSAPSRTSKSSSKALVAQGAGAVTKQPLQQQQQQVQPLIRLRYKGRKVILTKPETLDSAIRRVRQLFFITYRELEAQDLEIVLSAIIDHEGLEIGDEEAWKIVPNRAAVHVSLVTNVFKAATRLHRQREAAEYAATMRKEEEGEDNDANQEVDDEDSASNSDEDAYQTTLTVWTPELEDIELFPRNATFCFNICSFALVEEITHEVYARTGVAVDNQALYLISGGRLDMKSRICDAGGSRASGTAKD